MIFDSKSLAKRMAVIAFVAVSFICQMKNFDALVCLQRAVIGAIAVYFICILIVKTINTLIINAIINRQVENQLKQTNNTGNNDSRNEK